MEYGYPMLYEGEDVDEEGNMKYNPNLYDDDFDDDLLDDDFDDDYDPIFENPLGYPVEYAR